MKRLLKQFIIFILITMTLLNSIVPCNVVLAEDLTRVDVDGNELTKFELNVEDGVYIKFNNANVYYSTYENNSLKVITGDYNNAERIFSHQGTMRYYVKTSEYDTLSYTVYVYKEGEFVRATGADGNELSPVKVSERAGNVSQGVTANEENNASFLERLITIFFITIGDAAMWAIGVVAGGNISLDSLIFNKYPNTNLAIFKTSKYYTIYPNPFIANSGVLDALEVVYNTFSAIALTTFLASLLYIGLKILFGSTGSGKAKYQEYLVTWVKGVAILFAFPFVMRLVIDANYAFVREINEVAATSITNVQLMPQIEEVPFAGLDTTINFGGEDTESEKADLMRQMRSKAWTTGRVAYAICWLVLIGELIKFIFRYFKRLLITLFLIAIFPLVTMTYAIDKVGDGKSQAFDNWFKEFILNVFLQTFQALNYTIVMGLIFATGTSGTANFILILVGITYIAKGEDILRSIFGQVGGADTVKGALQSVVKTAAVVKLAKNATGGVKKAKDRALKLNDRRRGLADRSMRVQEARLNERVAALSAANANTPPIEAFMGKVSKNDRQIMDSAIDTVMNTSSSDTELKTAGQNINSYMNDARTREELITRLKANGFTEEEIIELDKEQSALKNFDVDVKNNLEVLINRRNNSHHSRMDRLSDAMLSAYGLDDKKLQKIQKDYQKAEKFAARNANRAAPKNKRNVPRVSGVTSIRAARVEEQRIADIAKDATLPETSEGISTPRASGTETHRKVKGYKLAEKKKKETNPTSAAESVDPIRKTYRDTADDVRGEKRTTQKNKTTQREKQARIRIEVKRRENAREKEVETIVNDVITTSGSSMYRNNYVNMARNVVDINDVEASTFERIVARESLESEISYIKLSARTPDEVAAANAAEKEIRSKIILDENTSRAINNVSEMYADYVGKPQENEAVFASVAVETLNSGSATLDELWWSYHTVKNNSISEINQKLEGNINEYAMNLAVETLNNTDELRAELGNIAQTRVDEAIGILKAHEKDGGVYRELMRQLQVDPRTLKVGQMPEKVTETKSRSRVVFNKSETTKEIERRLEEQERERERNDAKYEKSIYKVDDSFNADKESEKIRRKKIRLAKDIGKEVLRDTAATVGATTAFSSFVAVDKEHDSQKIAAATSLGGTLGAEVVDTVDYYAEETVDAIRELRDRLAEDRDGRNPIRFHK